MYPFVIIGPIVTLCGICLIFFGFEICVRYKKNARRVQDPEIDTMKNIHHIKHWMDPGKFIKDVFDYLRFLTYSFTKLMMMLMKVDKALLKETSKFIAAIIEFGWGNEKDDQYEGDHHQHHNYNHYPGIEISDRATLKGSAAAAKALNSVSPISDDQIYHNHNNTSAVHESENPHEVMAIEMTNASETNEATAVLVDNDISSDIFDESLRYSGIDRPRFMIQHAEQTEHKQRRGSFIPDEDRIANLFSPKKKGK